MAAGASNSASAMPPIVITSGADRGRCDAGPARSIAQPAGSAASATKMPIIEVNQPISTSEKPISLLIPADQRRDLAELRSGKDADQLQHDDHRKPVGLVT